MTMPQDISVLKYGSSVLTHPQQLGAVVHDIYAEIRRGRGVVAVVSAIGQHTNALLHEVRAIDPNPQHAAAIAAVLATGEQQSAGLLGIALSRAGVPSRLLTPAQLALTLSGLPLDGDPVLVDAYQIRAALQTVPVVVVPGFSGVSANGDCALMGRGGSDLTAVFLADRLRAAHCRLVKDVDGIYERDPALSKEELPPPQRYSHITYAQAHRVSEDLVQAKAISYLEQRQQTAIVSSLQHRSGTLVGAAASTVVEHAKDRPLRIVLLGLGIVGRGVYEHCLAQPAHFEVVGIGVRNRLEHIDPDDRLGIVSDDLAELSGRPHDVLVELTGDNELASSMITMALRNGRSAVTANKSLMAVEGPELIGLAAEFGTTLCYSAAVGGAAPMLEAVRRAAAAGAIVSLRGLLSGTCNVVLERMAQGESVSVAVSEAQRLGLSEANPERDLSGADSEDKLRLLVSLAFDIEPSAIEVRREGLDAIQDESLTSATAPDEVPRMVASVSAGSGAAVRLEALPDSDPLAGSQGAENRLLIELASGDSCLIHGTGAGRWPTAEAVMADLFELHAKHNAEDRAHDGERSRSLAEMAVPQ